MLKIIHLPTMFLLCFSLSISSPTTRLHLEASHLFKSKHLFPDAPCSDMRLSLCFLSSEAAGYRQSKVCFEQRILSVGGTLSISLLFSLPGVDNRTYKQPSNP